MAKKPAVKYFASRSAFYCRVALPGTNGAKQYRLAVGPDDSPAGPTYLAALSAYRVLLEKGSVTVAKDRNTVRAVLDAYLTWMQEFRSSGTFEIRRECYVKFCEDYGTLQISELTHFTVYQFCSKMRQKVWNPKAHRMCGWGNGHVRLFVDCLQSAFNWGVKTGLISKNPINGIEKPAGRSRGRETVLTPEQHDHILAAASKSFRQFLIALESTGARPGEIAAARAKDFDQELGAIVFHSAATLAPGEHPHKNANKGKTRTIFFTGSALEMVRALVARREPEELIFQTRQGNAWTTQTENHFCRAIKKKIGLAVFSPYSYRHTFSTRWLEQNGSIEVLAEILGNSPNVIRKHYSHLCGNPSNLRAQLERIRGS